MNIYTHYITCWDSPIGFNKHVYMDINLDITPITDGQLMVQELFSHYKELNIEHRE
jgi:hypothetical protein